MRTQTQPPAPPAALSIVFYGGALCLLALAWRHGLYGMGLLAGGAGWMALSLRLKRRSAAPPQGRNQSGSSQATPAVGADLGRPDTLRFAEDGPDAQTAPTWQAELAARDADLDALRLEINARQEQQDALRQELDAQNDFAAEQSARTANALLEAEQAREQESGWQALAVAAQTRRAEGEQEQKSAFGRISGLADELAGQVVTCLAEAEQSIGAAIEAFTRIAGEAQEAAALAQQTVGVEAENSVSGIATRATDVMGLFIEAMLSSAGRISQTAGQLERLSDVSRRLCGLAGDVESVADQTALVALNASIEAARAGHAGRTFTVVAKEVSKLAQTSRSMAERMRGLTGELSSETQAIHTDLTRMAQSSRDESSSAQAEVKRLLAQLKQADTATRDTLARLGERSQNITANYASIVMAFQFHDLLRQRLEHVAQPLTELSAELRGEAGEQSGESVLKYAVGQNEFQARAVGAAPTLEVVTYTPEQDDNITLF